jgi:hypothetical protein
MLWKTKQKNKTKKKTLQLLLTLNFAISDTGFGTTSGGAFGTSAFGSSNNTGGLFGNSQTKPGKGFCLEYIWFICS